jgi:hypothetical protein
MLTDSFALAIRVRRQKDSFSFFRRLFQLGDDLFVIPFLGVGDDLISRLEIMLDVDTEPLRREILNMADRRLNEKITSQILVYSFRLRRRLNNN